MSYTALQQSYVSCNYPHLGHVTEVPGSPFPIAFRNFCKFPAANTLSSPFWLWLQLLLDFWSHSHLTSWSWSLPSAELSQIWDLFPFLHALPKRKIYTYTNSIKTLCVHQPFLKLWKDRWVLYYHVAWLLHPLQTLLSFGRGLPFPQETKFPSYYSEQLSSPSPYLWHPTTHS